MNKTVRLTATSISKEFKGKTVWSDISFCVDPGTVVALTGSSGSGKTTLLNCIGLLESVTTGTISVGEVKLNSLNSRGRRNYFRDTVGFLFQNYGLVESWSVDRNLDIALEYSGLERKEKAVAKSAVLHRVGLAASSNNHIFSLSGGEQQRIGLARLLLKKPSLILADEPSGALDDSNAEIVADVLRECSAAGAVVLMSTHDARMVQRCDESIALPDRAR